MRLRLSVLMLLTLTGCSPDFGPNPPRTVDAVDLNRYQGTWYEIARLPLIYQKDCLQSEAVYQLNAAKNEMSVTNRCTTAQGGLKEAQGTAWPQEQGQTSRLWVRFHNFISDWFPSIMRGHYWVLYLDPDYQVSLVGTPDREHLWLLARTPSLSPSEREKAFKVATEQGYDLKNLIWSPSVHDR